MDDLVRWYGEQLDEDERIARDQLCINCGSTVVPIRSDLGITGYTHGANEATLPGKVAWQGRRCPGSVTGAVPVQNPDRCLREVEAKRDLLRVAAAAHDYHETFMNGFASALEGTLRLYASAYSDRPGYRQEWAP
ncbi:DUF6221 family protein [Streptomyces sp. NPDC005302]|uniref:DUF6221 family protein n=1 Tax=Streptomyces sp. NPDC005302 TaxID=3154675 RepID=UPI0033A10696